VSRQGLWLLAAPAQIPASEVTARRAPWIVSVIRQEVSIRHLQGIENQAEK
jgi:hypothetical protein